MWNQAPTSSAMSASASSGSDGARTWALLLLMLAASGCRSGPADSFCLIAEPIRPAASDVLSDRTVAEIAPHNAAGERLCGWRP